MGYLADKHPFAQLAIGIGIVVLSAIIFANLIDFSIYYLAPGETITSVLKNNQTFGLTILILNHIGMFILPAFIMLRLFSKPDQPYVSFKNAPLKKYGHALLILLGIMFVSGLIVKGTELLINLTPLKDWAYELQNQSTGSLKSLLAPKQGLGILVLKVLAISVIPAIGEELIFRGILIKNFFHLTNNKHVAVLISAFLFSLMHFQPYNFLAFILIGMAFGYIYWKYRDIKITILLHFLFNLASLLMIEFGFNEM
jgi:membrane protease YdiL (CAAX protease family)